MKIIEFLIINICSLLLIYSIYEYSLLRKKKSMKNKEEVLKKQGITPSGTKLSTGMVLTKNGVKEIKKPNSAWYIRLT